MIRSNKNPLDTASSDIKRKTVHSSKLINNLSR